MGSFISDWINDNRTHYIFLFRLLFLVHKPNPLIAPIVLIVGWTILIVLPIIGPTVIETKEKGPFYGLSGAWCWLSVPYGTERLIYLYVSLRVSTSHNFIGDLPSPDAPLQLWVFVALGSSIVIYCE